MSDPYNEPREPQEDEVFPTELDITKYIGEALRGGMTITDIARAIVAGFKGIDPFKIEQLSDDLLDLKDEAKKTNNEPLPF